MKWLKRTISHPVVKWLIGSITTIVSFVTIDFTPAIDSIFNVDYITGNSNPSEMIELIDDMSMVLDTISKVAIGMLLLSIIVFSFSIISRQRTTYSALKIISYINKHKIVIDNLTVFGYSLSFAQAVREHLQNVSNRKAAVTIIVPHENFIRTTLSDDTPLESRIQTLAGRIYEWEQLKNENRISSIDVIRTKDVPLEHGILINDNIFFYYYYKWSYDLGERKFVFEKHDQEHRLFLLLKKSDSENEFDMLSRRLSIKIGLSTR